jgi:multiple sugar transport system ATP-binding protein
MASVKLTSVYKTFGEDVHAVNDFNLEIKDKEFVVLVGPSGCGKSTTLRMVAGLEEISKGEIYIDGKLVNDVPPKDRDIAMVFQNYALYPHMDVYQNMAFGLKLRKYPKLEIDKRVKEAAEILDIESLLERRPRELSGGQMQRVALGRAIVRNCKVYLLDEPLSNLDAKLRVEMRAELNRLHSRLKSTMIYVTHDQTEAMTLGDRIVIMLAGTIQQVATPIEIYDNPENKFVGSFIGTPPMNFLEGRLVKAGTALAFQIGPHQIQLSDVLCKMLADQDGREVCFGIRPENVSDTTYNKISGQPGIPANVEVIERLGNEMVVHTTVEGQKLILREDAHYSAEVNQTINLHLNVKRVHIFDRTTEKNLTKRAPEPV